jgi:hypothetical protein
MFDTLPETDDAHAPPAETRAERRMRRLEQMSELGLSIGRKLERQAELASAHAEIGQLKNQTEHACSRRIDEIARAFAQVCRAVALATAIEDRIDQGLPAIPDIERNARLREQAAKDRRDAAECAVEATLYSDPTVQTRRRMAEVKIDLGRLLDRELLNLDAFLTQPLPQIIARLRRDLGLAVEEEDEGLSEEGPNPPTPQNPSPSRGRMGPVAQQREDGVTEARRPDRQAPTPVAKTQTARTPLTPSRRQPAQTPSSRSASPNGAHPSPSRGRIHETRAPP